MAGIYVSASKHTIIYNSSNNNSYYYNSYINNIHAHNIQKSKCKCQGNFTLWIGDMAKYTEDTITPEVERKSIQQYTLEYDQATTHRKLNKGNKMEVDRT